MRISISFEDETFCTERALEPLVSQVTLLVRFQVALLVKGNVTELTFKCLLANCMNRGMLTQIAKTKECRVALVALVWFLATVRDHVALHVPFVSELLVANRTSVLCIGVDEHVFLRKMVGKLLNKRVSP